MITNDLKVLLYVLLTMGAAMLCAGWGMAAVAETAAAWWGVLFVLAVAAGWMAWFTWGDGRLPGALPWLALALILGGAGALWVSEAGAVWVFLGVVSAVAAWDVSLFYGRLHSHAAYISGEKSLIRSHLVQLAWLAGLSILGFTAWALLNLPYEFDRTLLMVLLLLWGLSYLLRQLRAGEN